MRKPNNSKLAALRVAKGLKLKDAAKLANVSWQTICEMENGRSNVTMRVLQSLATVYGVKVNDIVDAITGKDTITSNDTITG